MVWGAMLFRNTGTLAFPPWVFAMISATPTPTTFDLAAASAFASSISEFQSREFEYHTETTTFAKSDILVILLYYIEHQKHWEHPDNHFEGIDAQVGIHPGALIGIIIGVCLMACLAVFLLCLKRRRRREPQEAYTNDSTTPYPILFADIATAIPLASNSEARSVTKIRQQYLRNELRATQEKIIHIQTQSLASSTQGTRVGRLLQAFSARGASDTRSGSRDPEIVIREMAARIRELEAELELPWMRGLSDEPPPRYSEEEP
ncbi:hypothetical protein GGX14DRAFT_572095 [Mycena pura]|uniref:Uncharacterized protein n=1 Tax=Mycena pura TaxID=153505 RepID=A0AAD6Y5I1_9AGAR|nr:hypothetical protein GGX14DRAFT_572095 [Mycena pura]